MTLSADRAAFVWSAEEIRRVGSRVTELVAAHLTDLPGRPVFEPFPPSVAEAMRSAAPPEAGQSVDAILSLFEREISPYPFGNGHPRFAAWVNSPPAPIAIFATALAAAMNPSCAGGNHAAIHVERQVVEWLRRIVGFPEESKGLLVAGGSAAALTALAVARHRALARRGWNVRSNGLQGAPRSVIYQTAEGHSCHQKAAELLGIGSAKLRIVPSDDQLRMIPEELANMLDEDLAAGHLPVAVIASAGTVNTGAIDPLDRLADVCGARDVWLHVDGAYGAPAILLDEFRAALEGLGRCDSLAMDPHKWLSVPVDAGLVLVRDAAAMRDAFSLVPPYLRTDADEYGVQGPPWFSEYGLEQTRPFRALKIWAALRYFGLDGYREMIAHDVRLARHLAAGVRKTADLQLWEPQGLGIVCFRAAPATMTGQTAALDALNRRVLQDVQLGGKAFLSSTVLRGTFWLRACIVNARAAEEDVAEILDAVIAAAERARSEVSLA